MHCSFPILKPFLKNIKKENYSSLFPEETADAVTATADGYVHAVEQLIASSYMLGMIHADEEKPRNGFTAADENTEEIHDKLFLYIFAN